ncbi:MAG: cytochrome c [Actinomycetota bacterium]
MRNALLPIATVAAAAVLVGACGEDRAPDKPMSEGQVLIISSGCSACHGRNGEGGMAPSWHGIYMSTVTLDDDTKVVVDDQYLVRSIKDPTAQQVKGFSIMPPNSLTDVEIQRVIDYIRSLK